MMDDRGQVVDQDAPDDDDEFAEEELTVFGFEKELELEELEEDELEELEDEEDDDDDPHGLGWP